MAFAWLNENNFETNVIGWTSETDTESRLNVVHYTAPQLVSNRVTPYRGAYCMHIGLAASAADAYIQEDTAFDTAAAGTIFVRFYFLAKGLVMAASDRFTIFALESAAGTNEVAISIVNNAGDIQIVASETGATALGAATRATSLIQNKWHCIEIKALIDSGVGNDGTIDFFVDGYQIGSTISTLDQGAIVHARLGFIGGDAGTTAGNLYYDEVYADDARLFPFKDRWPNQLIFTKTGHAFVGPGSVSTAALLSTTAGNILKLFDTDVANSDNEMDAVVELAVGNQTSFEGPIRFNRGCYVLLTGTTPRGQVIFDMDNSFGESPGPTAYGSDAAILNYAVSRTARASGNVG